MLLVTVVQQLSLARDLSAVQQIVRREARRLTGADGATFVLRDNDQCHYADEDAIAPLWKGMRFPMRACISGWTMLHRQPVVIPDIYADERIPADAYRPTFVKSLVMVPIRSLDPIGAIGTYWATHHEATEDEVSVLQALADATAVAMENVRVYRELEQRVRDRTRELEAARQLAQQALDDADRAHRAKSRFLAAASHDLRQPLQSLALLNGTLHRLVGEADAQVALDQQALAINAASRLVNALLDVSKAESGAIKPEITDFALTELFEEMGQEFASQASSKGLALRVERCSESVRCDRSLVEQIVRNLVSNAIKYTRHGHVQLRCVSDTGAARVEVLDTGVGISADHLPHIFDEFYQIGVASSRSRDGYGLGLSIVSRLVKLLNLKLDVRSEPGRGSVFSLVLPLGAVSATSAGPAAGEHRPQDDGRRARRRRILLVEDDAGVREATRLLLKTEGYDVVTATCADEALAKVDEHQSLDLLISDYHLGGGETGLHVISAVRDRLGKNANVILVSGDTSPRIRGLDLDDHTRLASKPVDVDQLLTLITDLIGDTGAVRPTEPATRPHYGAA